MELVYCDCWVLSYPQDPSFLEALFIQMANSRKVQGCAKFLPFKIIEATVVMGTLKALSGAALISIVAILYKMRTMTPEESHLRK